MPEITRKPLTWFRVNPQVWKTFDEDGLRRLGESLKVRQLQPVLAQPDGTIIVGEGRWQGAGLVGMDELEVIIADRQLSEVEVKLCQLIENLQRKKLTGYEQWLGCADILALNTGWGGKELAEHLHLDPSTITRLLSPSKCVGTVQLAL